MAEQQPNHLQNMKQSPPKWEGKAAASLKGVTSSEIWPLLSDFCNIHLWFPHVATCYAVSGVSGEPGMVRYCASSDEKWAKERLVEIDQEEKWFKYEILENNAGFGEYVATWRVVDGGDGGCVVEWSYVAEPVVGLTAQDLMKFVEGTLGVVVSRLNQALVASNEVGLVCNE